VRRVFPLVIVLLVFLSASSAGSPLVVQPLDSSYTPSQRSALLAGIDRLEENLSSGYPGSQRRLSALGWGEADYINFVAGTLDSFGYPVAIVAVDDWDGESHSFLLVGIDLGGGTTGWIPVEADPYFLGSFWLLGRVPWDGQSTDRFDPRYLSYDRLVGYVEVTPPAITLFPPGSPVINDPAAAMAVVNGGRARILAYQWSIDGGEAITTSVNALWHTFTEAGKHTVSVTVIDELGGRASAEASFEVLKERHSCSCGS